MHRTVAAADSRRRDDDAFSAGEAGDGDVPKPVARVGSVLFACTHNAIRSPMAQAILERLAGGRIYSRSVGVVSDLPVDGFAVAVMEEIGIDLTRHNPHTFQDLEEWGEEIDGFDLIVALSPAAQRRALEYTRQFAVEVEYWPAMDPTAVEGDRERRLDAYRELRESLERRIRLRFDVRSAPVV